MSRVAERKRVLRVSRLFPNTCVASDPQNRPLFRVQFIATLHAGECVVAGGGTISWDLTISCASYDSANRPT